MNDEFGDTLARYFAGDLDRIERARFDRLVETSASHRARFDAAWDARVEVYGPLAVAPSDGALDDCFSIDTLGRYANRSLTPEEVEQVDAHLGCLMCSEQLTALRESPPPRAFSPLAWLASHWRAVTLVAAPVAAMGVLFIAAPPDALFTPRGSDHRLADVVDAAFTLAGRDLKAGDQIDPGARIGLRYTNPISKTPVYLLAFAVDTRGLVFWYFPAWSDPDDNPLAVRGEVGAHRPGEVVVHDLEPGRLRLVTLFTTTRYDVRTVEKAITKWRADGGRIDAPSLEIIDGAAERSVVVEVRP